MLDKTRFFDLSNEEKIQLTYKDFTVSEITEIIAETVLSNKDREIAMLRFTKLMTYEDIAERVDLDWKTVQKRVPMISEKLKQTVYRLLYQHK